MTVVPRRLLEIFMGVSNSEDKVFMSP